VIVEVDIAVVVKIAEIVLLCNGKKDDDGDMLLVDAKETHDVANLDEDNDTVRETAKREGMKMCICNPSTTASTKR